MSFRTWVSLVICFGLVLCCVEGAEQKIEDPVAGGSPGKVVAPYEDGGIVGALGLTDTRRVVGSGTETAHVYDLPEMPAPASAPAPTPLAHVASQQKVPNPQLGEYVNYLGRSVAVEGDVLVAGAPFTGIDDELYLGVARVYRKGAGGVWEEEAELCAPTSDGRGYVGASVALSSGTALLGAPRADAAGNSSGCAHVFVCEAPGRWRHQATLVGSTTGDRDWMGEAVALQGDTAAVSARADGQGGSVYIFEPDESGVWYQMQRLLAIDQFHGINFGSDIAISGDTLVVGAFGATGRAAATGAVYVYVRGPSGWQH